MKLLYGEDADAPLYDLQDTLRPQIDIRLRGRIEGQFHNQLQPVTVVWDVIYDVKPGEQ